MYDSKASIKLFSKRVVDTLNDLGMHSVEHHYCGKGAAAGICIEHTLAVHRKLKHTTNRLNPDALLPCPRAEAHSLKAALECILAGSYWPNDRVKSIRPEATDTCSRCGQPDSALHQFWTCAHNEHIDDPRVVSTQDLIPLAVAEADDFPCLWLRGLLPSSRLDYT